MMARRETSPSKLVAKKTAGNAPVWQHFGFQPNEKGEPANVDVAVCKLCMRDVKAKGGNTSNLVCHLEKNHAREFNKLPKPQAPRSKLSQPSLQSSFAKVQKYHRDSQRWKTCTRAVTKYLAKEMVSFRTVEKQSFKDLLTTLDPQYELPGRKYISGTEIPQLYKEVRCEVEQLLAGVDSYALTTDMWSARNMAPYMSLTVNTITKEWKLESRVLQTSYLPENHTAENLATALKDALEQWKLDEGKLSAITTDNGANIAAAIRDLGWPWINCFGHNLNIAVTNTVQEQKRPVLDRLANVRTITGAFSHSWNRRRELYKKQAERGKKQQDLKTVMGL